MAGDDDILEPEDLEDLETEETDDSEDIEIDPDLDVDVLEEELDEDIDDDVVGDEFEDLEEGDEAEDAETTGPARRSVVEDEDDDDEMLAPDDVEADLDTILKDRLEAADDEANEEEEPEERGESADRLQPKRADEQLCPSCFLLVRQSAPSCPVGDDECPLFR